ncbi:prolactin-releasing peptide receptor-like [Patiria miniata]|uniref:G-protein coupled receptors family 1 profile domain-containing protein n=1 Tax=Patiria miniata TaxID=46514 RepID=A0A914B9A3_PATMI|nr:prolactin-releasing peptide receptor-like [Patiria miniata]
MQAYPSWLSVLLLLIAVVGFLSNVLVIVNIFKSRFLHDVTHYLILNLAVSDGLCCFIFGLEMFMDLLNYPNNRTGGIAEILYCRLINGNYVFQSFAFISAYNLVIISLERYIGIVKPLRYVQICNKAHTWLAIFLSWVLGSCVYLLHLIGVQYLESETEFNIRCRNKHPWQWHFLSFTVGFVAPLLIMIWAYSRIIKALKQSALNQAVSAQAAETREATKRVVHLMLIVTITYAVLYVPTQPVYIIIVSVNQQDFEQLPLGILLTDILTKLPVLLNSIANPFIYAFKYKKFRKGMRDLMCRCAKNTISPNEDVMMQVDTANSNI